MKRNINYFICNFAEFLLKFRLFLAAGMAAFATASVFAAEAAFSLDGTLVYKIDDHGFATIGLHPYTQTPVDLSPWIGEEPIEAVTLRTTDGALLAATANAIWTYDPAKKTVQKLIERPVDPTGDTRIDDIAFDPSTGGVLMTVFPKYKSNAEFAAWFLPKGAAKPKEIFVRRLERFTGPVFAPDGALFFSTEGDIWRGKIDPQEDEDMPERYGVLTAVRYAPLAVRETYMGTPCQIGARELAWAGSKLYAHVARMGGSGWGKIVRLNVPQPTEKTADKAITEPLEQRVKTYTSALNSIEVLGENGGRCNLCATPDGKHVFYTLDGKFNQKGELRYIPYEVEENGVPKPLIEESEKSLTPSPSPSH